MAGDRGTYVDGPKPYHSGDAVRDIGTCLTATQQLMQDLTGGLNPVFSGFTLTAAGGMQVQVGAGICWANGLRAATVQTTLTLNPTTTNPRYTIIRVTVVPNNPDGTDGTTGNSLVADTNAVDFVDGAAANPPAKPVLSSAYQVQVGSVLLPANTSTITSAMLSTLDCSPNSVGPFGAELPNSLTHRQASLASAVVHGFQATLPAGTGTNQLSLTGPRGGVGALEGNWWFPGSGQTPPTDGFMLPATNGSSSTDGYFWELNPATTGSNTAAKLNISGKLSAALALLKLWASTVEVTGGLQIDGPVNALGSISAVSLNATTITESGAPVPSEDAQGRVPYAVKADQLTTAGTPYYIDHGETPPQTVGNQSTQLYTVTFNRTFTATAHPTVIPAPIATGGPVGMQYGMQCLVVSYTGSAGAWTGCVIELGQTTSAAQSLAVGWIAVGN